LKSALLILILLILYFRLFSFTIVMILIWDSTDETVVMKKIHIDVIFIYKFIT